MRVNASLGFFYFLIFIIVYRQVTKTDSLQQIIHRIGGGRLAPVLQWYSLFLGGVLTFVVYSVYELFVKYDSLNRATIAGNLQAIYGLPVNEHLREEMRLEAFQEPLLIEPWLWCLHLVSQVVGIPVVCIAMIHVWKLLVLPCKRLADERADGGGAPWKPPTGMNRLLLVITMPTIFCVMSLRAACRVLAVMTGTAHGHDSLPWTGVASMEFSMYNSDLELAALFQFSTVYAFARICGYILSDRAIFKVEGAGRDAAEYTWAIKTVGFLGVWAFVIVGMVRSLFCFFIAEAEQFEPYATTADMLQQAASESISLVFSVITILCVINMFVICKMSIITDALGNATRKFMGTRLLLVVFEMQANVVEAFTVGSSLYHQVEMHAQKYNIPIHKWKFSKEQACLFHLSLLNLECLVVVIFNIIVWRGLDMRAAGIVRFGHSNVLSNNLPGEREVLLEGASQDFIAGCCGVRLVRVPRDDDRRELAPRPLPVWMKAAPA